jgi:hypothetical protein
MGLEHLDGKRTGRPRGARSAPWLRDLRWAYRNLGGDAEPPSDLAKRLLALGREHPDRLVTCLVQLEAVAAQQPEARRAAERTDRKVGEEVDGPGARVEGPRGRVKKLRVTEAQLMAYLSGRRYPWIRNLPPAVEIVACEREPGGKAVFVLTLRAEAFPLVAEGQEVPEFEVEFAYPER